MSEYRTPREDAEAAEQDARISQVLADATVNFAVMLNAINDRESPALVEVWVDRLYDDLRDRLDREDLIRAVILLLTDAAQDKAEELSEPLPDLSSPVWGDGLDMDKWRRSLWGGAR